MNVSLITKQLGGVLLGDLDVDGKELSKWIFGNRIGISDCELT
jgi:hypothetical protein